MPGDKDTPIESKKLLVVEGKDEKIFFMAFLKIYDVDSVHIYPLNGCKDLVKDLGMLKKVTGFSNVEKLALILDCDDDPGAAKQRITNALERNGLAVPEKPLVFKGENPGVMYYLSPTPDEKGCLESLCIESVNKESYMECVNSFMECIQHKGMTFKNTNHHHKAIANTIISCFKEPQVSVGVAARKGYWNLKASCFDNYKHIIDELNKD